MSRHRRWRNQQRPGTVQQSKKRLAVTQLYRSPNGDAWFLARDPGTGLAFVRHEANKPSGGQVTDIDIGAFLNGPRNAEQEALLRVIGGVICGTGPANPDDGQSSENAGKEWSDVELTELGNMLMRGLPLEEIARGLRRDHGEVRDKVVEVGRACRGSAHIATPPHPTSAGTSPDPTAKRRGSG